MTATQAKAALAKRGYAGRAADAAALVIAGEASRTQAAKLIGVDIAAIIRTLKKVTIERTCPCCGHTIKEFKL